MAATLISRAGKVATNFKNKAVAVAAVVLAADDSARANVTTSPTITAGTGAPAEASPDGSLYLRTDGADADDSMYIRVSGAWIAHKGQTA